MLRVGRSSISGGQQLKPQGCLVSEDKHGVNVRTQKKFLNVALLEIVPDLVGSQYAEGMIITLRETNMVLMKLKIMETARPRRQLRCCAESSPHQRPPLV